MSYYNNNDNNDNDNYNNNLGQKIRGSVFTPAHLSDDSMF